MMSAKFLIIAGITGSAAFILEGLLCFAMCEANVRAYVLSVYYILFGALSIGAELKFEVIRKFLFILFSHFGRGIWYLFLAAIALGS